MQKFKHINKHANLMQKTRLQIGFTLIELLVVIAIIGILSGLIITTMSGATESARIAKLKVYSNSVRDTLGANLVSEWKFDGSGKLDGETASAVYVKDTWGNNTGTISGTPKVYSGSSCVSGSCLNFNGSTDFIDYGDPTDNSLDFGVGVSFTISAWMKRNDLSTHHGIVIAKGGMAGRYIFGCVDESSNFGSLLVNT